MQGVYLRLVVHCRFDSSTNAIAKSSLSKKHHKMRDWHSKKRSANIYNLFAERLDIFLQLRKTKMNQTSA